MFFKYFKILFLPIIVVFAMNSFFVVNEFQQVAVDDYLNNWPDTPHICGDIKDVTGEQIMQMTGLKKGELDILDGSPPCPPFSMSGTKQKGWGKEKVA